MTKARDKLNRNRLSASATDKLDDPEWRLSLVEAARQRTGGRRSTGRVIALKKEEKKADQGDDKKNDSYTAMDIALD